MDPITTHIYECQKKKEGIAFHNVAIWTFIYTTNFKLE